MKKIASILAVAALALSGAAQAQSAAAVRSETKLAKMLDGRVAGEPVRCISAMRSNNIEVLEHVGIVYDAGETIYVARSADPRALGVHDVPVIERFGSQLCSSDSIRTIDRHNGHFSGVVFLDDFVPYRRAG